ncbi:LptF/LptG family permease [Epilithonimonas hungarica]|uniref:Lipopolysaccharide export system permease protein n=1 Tax=Epilithonimonas hungarica TaxID=454006 RepID=A0A1G7J4F5_9FLAO|nr:LptF/LptG family permease [Epilithonimonas hungarica]MDP9956232.1 lipopolysaccharide export system permease protein [Epilithonimonas hungarica]MPT31008.1 YjgP/YjgQ family permease [Chryseobacterium sp.]SDF19887.1 lipopolysaccharide export system permease protein [Epilithonimonas hungarica]
MKKLDKYIIKTFFGPFLFIFSVLFFIFIVNIIWTQMSQLTGKGLTYWEISKFLFYLGINVVSMVLPLTILLSSIMTFGDFGERYELAAMKAAGISLVRVMMPLFLTVSILSGILFLFSNNVIPDFQRKAKNMMYNIISSKPAINFTPGVFIDQITGFSVKFDKISGEKSEKLEGVFLHKNASPYDDQQTIIAKTGKFAPAADRNYLKLILYNGFVFTDNITNKPYEERKKQPNQSIKFDTLVYHFDISELINNAIEKEKITDDYRFQTYSEVNETLVKNRKGNIVTLNSIASPVISQTNNYVEYIDRSKSKDKIKEPYKIDTLKSPKKLEVLYAAYNKIESLKTSIDSNQNAINDTIKTHNKIVMYQQRIISYSFTCIIFFMIGASLGSIIRKGGMGLPVVISIIIFIIFYVLNLSVENLSWKGSLNPYLAAWIPNIVLFPFSIWLTYKALTDSQLFDIEKYKALFKPLIERFSKPKEHERYQ